VESTPEKVTNRPGSRIENVLVAAAPMDKIFFWKDSEPEGTDKVFFERVTTLASVSIAVIIVFGAIAALAVDTTMFTDRLVTEVTAMVLELARLVVPVAVVVTGALLVASNDQVAA
jgi:hypothetical protein